MENNGSATTPVPTVVDLFCGAGGLSLGFCRAGFQCVGAYDSWFCAVKTHRRNLGTHVHHVEITRELKIPRSTVVIGGPPCQGFSSAGMRRGDDTRNSLVSVFAHLVTQSLPEAFIFENVEGFLTASNGIFVQQLLEPLLAVGYKIHLRKINAANYGVPQHRKRVIAIGALHFEPSFPRPTHSAYGAPGAHRATELLPIAPNIQQALAGLPNPTFISPSEPDGHFIEPLSPLDLQRARLLKQGQTMRDLPPDLWHESYRKRANRRVKDGTPTERRGGAPAGLRRLEASLPSKAITGGAQAEFIHPTEDRPLTIRECARLQTFPDTFAFAGRGTELIQQIGNAVPPLLGEQIARSLRRDLEHSLPKTTPGRLLSFHPTFADAMSPALQHVVDMVDSRFGSGSATYQANLWD